MVAELLPNLKPLTAGGCGFNSPPLDHEFAVLDAPLSRPIYASETYGFIGRLLRGLSFRDTDAALAVQVHASKYQHVYSELHRSGKSELAAAEKRQLVRDFLSKVDRAGCFVLDTAWNRRFIDPYPAGPAPHAISGGRGVIFRFETDQFGSRGAPYHSLVALL